MQTFYWQLEKLTRPAGLDGWCSLEKAKAMVELVLEYRPLVSVEIGVFGGRSLIAQALACKSIQHGHVHGIDPWTAGDALNGVQEKENIDWWGKLDYQKIYRNCLVAVLEYDVSDYCTVLRMTSDRAHAAFDYIDVLHIDGNHSEAASTLDVCLYLPKVRSGGYIWFDDVDWPTTKNAIRLVEERCEKISEVGTCSLYRKH